MASIFKIACHFFCCFQKDMSVELSKLFNDMHMSHKDGNGVSH